MSAGIYVLPVGSFDPQSLRKQDEMYYVVRDRARMLVGSKDQPLEIRQYKKAVLFCRGGSKTPFYE